MRESASSIGFLSDNNPDNEADISASSDSTTDNADNISGRVVKLLGLGILADDDPASTVFILTTILFRGLTEFSRETWTDVAVGQIQRM